MRVEVCEAPRMMLDGLRMQTRPGGETTDVRVTVPVNPLTGATVMAELAGEPALVVTLLGLAVTVKSWTVNVTVVEWDSEPLVPVTVTV